MLLQVFRPIRGEGRDRRNETIEGNHHLSSKLCQARESISCEMEGSETYSIGSVPCRHSFRKSRYLSELPKRVRSPAKIRSFGVGGGKGERSGQHGDGNGLRDGHHDEE